MLSTENLKKEIGIDAAQKTPARYALCELVNLHDKSLEFEAIHRVVFDLNGEEFLAALGKEYDLSFDKNEDGQHFKFVYNGEIKDVTVLNPKEYLTVATLQKFMDSYIEKNEEKTARYADLLSKRCCFALGVMAASTAILNLFQRS